jgi:hypothetical protein
MMTLFDKIVKWQYALRRQSDGTAQRVVLERLATDERLGALTVLFEIFLDPSAH